MNKQIFKLNGISIKRPPIDKNEKWLLSNIACVEILDKFQGKIEKLRWQTCLGDCDPLLWQFLNISPSQAKSTDQHGQKPLIGMLPFDLWLCTLQPYKQAKMAYGCSFREAINAALLVQEAF